MKRKLNNDLCCSDSWGFSCCDWGYLAKIVFNEKKYKNEREIEGKEAKILTKYSFKKDEWGVKDKIVFPVQSCFEVREEEKKKLFFSSPKHQTRSFGHGLIFGGSGRGKTSKLVEPMLYFNGLIEGEINKPSMIIPDSASSSEESLFRKYAGWLKVNGYQIKVLNLVDNEKISDIKQEQVIGSDFWNPLRVIYEVREFEDVKQKPTAVFIKADFDKADKAIMQYINLFISQIGTYWMNDTDKRDLINIIDEFNSFPKLDKLSYFLERESISCEIALIFS